MSLQFWVPCARLKWGVPGIILVIDHGGRMDINSYGGVAGFTTRNHGLVGCVIDGVTRDIDEYKDLNLPVYGRGFIQQSIRNRCACVGYQIEVKLGGVSVHPGDLIVADENGICVVLSNLMEEVLRFAQLFKSIEEKIIEEVQNGADPVKAHERVRYDLMTKAGYEPN
jgi:regulator of RNase E activity RraA